MLLCCFPIQNSVTEALGVLKTGNVTTGIVMIGIVTAENVITGIVTTGIVITGNVITEIVKTGNPIAGIVKTGIVKIGIVLTGIVKTGSQIAGNVRTEIGKIEIEKTGIEIGTNKTDPAGTASGIATEINLGALIEIGSVTETGLSIYPRTLSHSLMFTCLGPL